MDAILDKEEDIRAEMNVFQNHSHHPNIVNFLGAYLYKSQQVDDQLWIIMEVYMYIIYTFKWESHYTLQCSIYLGMRTFRCTQNPRKEQSRLLDRN